MKKLKNIILKDMAYVMAVILIMSVCSIDSGSIIPVFTMGVSTAYLLIFYLANEDRFNKFLN